MRVGRGHGDERLPRPTLYHPRAVGVALAERVGPADEVAQVQGEPLRLRARHGLQEAKHREVDGGHRRDRDIVARAELVTCTTPHPLRRKRGSRGLPAPSPYAGPVKPPAAGEAVQTSCSASTSRGINTTMTTTTTTTPASSITTTLPLLLLFTTETTTSSPTNTTTNTTMTITITTTAALATATTTHTTNTTTTTTTIHNTIRLLVLLPLRLLQQLLLPACLFAPCKLMYYIPAYCLPTGSSYGDNNIMHNYEAMVAQVSPRAVQMPLKYHAIMPSNATSPVSGLILANGTIHERWVPFSIKLGMSSANHAFNVVSEGT